MQYLIQLWWLRMLHVTIINHLITKYDAINTDDSWLQTVSPLAVLGLFHLKEFFDWTPPPPSLHSYALAPLFLRIFYDVRLYFYYRNTV